MTMRFLSTGLLTIALLAISACGRFGPDTGSLLDPTEGASPETDFDELVASAIRKAVVDDKDIPDYHLIDDKSNIVISSRTSEGKIVTLGALPEANAVEFVLLSPDAIQKVANDDGDFVYLHVDEVDVAEESATVSISTRWAVAEDSEVMYLSGGGYQLQYVKSDGRWTFEKVLMMWIS